VAHRGVKKGTHWIALAGIEGPDATGARKRRNVSTLPEVPTASRPIKKKDNKEREKRKNLTKAFTAPHWHLKHSAEGGPE